MKKQQDYRIYALIAGKKAFVGKTMARDLKPICWRHLRGENRYTMTHFARGSPEKISIHVLAQVHADFSIAYRYVVAFVRIFLDNGYTVLNSPGILEDANDIHEMTQKILDELKIIPLQQRLEMGEHDEESANIGSDHPETAPKKVNADTKERATEKLTIRVTPQEKQRFVDYTHQIGVTQRQAIQLLLVRKKYDDWLDADWSCDEYVRSLLKVYCEENVNLEKEIVQLENKIKELEQREAAELKDKERFMRKGVGEFFEFFDSSKRGNATLEQGVYRKVNKDLLDVDSYRNPGQEGFFLFYPERILLGEGRFAPLFVLGEDEYRKKTMLRYYPKKYFTGFSFTNEKFGLQESTWFVGVEQAKDGAMEVAFALPVDIQLRGKAAEQKTEYTIEDLISNAMKDLKYDDIDLFGF